MSPNDETLPVNTSFSTPDGGAAQASVNASVDVSPRKPSIRIIDGPATREEDLENGPLLDHISGGFQGDDAADYQVHIKPEVDSDTILRASDPDRPVGLHSSGRQDSILGAILSPDPFVEYAESRAQSVPSLGKSFSVLTESTPDINQGSQAYGSDTQTGPRQNDMQSPKLPATPKFEPSINYDRNKTHSELSTKRSLPMRGSSKPSSQLGSLDPSWSVSPSISTTRHNSTTEDVSLGISELCSTFESIQRQRAIACPWMTHLEWKDGHLLLNGELMSTQRSTTSSVAVYGDTVAREPLPILSIQHDQTHQGSILPDEFNTDTHSAGLRSEMLHRAKEKLVEALDYHYKTVHGPQRPNRRTNCSSSGGNGANRSSSNTANTASWPYSRSAPSSGQRRNGLTGGDGEEEEEDDDDDEHERDRQGALEVKQRPVSRRFACPIAKGRPMNAPKSCCVKLGTISNVKDHLRQKHCTIYCSRCLLVFHDKAHAELHKRIEFCWRPDRRKVSFITVEIYQDIKRCTNTKDSPEEQWRKIFSMLFPNEPCPDPYIADEVSERFDHLDKYLHRSALPHLRRILMETVQDFTIRHVDLEPLIQHATQTWSTQFVGQFRELGNCIPNTKSKQQSPSRISDSSAANSQNEDELHEPSSGGLYHDSGTTIGLQHSSIFPMTTGNLDSFLPACSSWPELPIDLQGTYAGGQSSAMQQINIQPSAWTQNSHRNAPGFPNWEYQATTLNFRDSTLPMIPMGLAANSNNVVDNGYLHARSNVQEAIPGVESVFPDGTTLIGEQDGRICGESEAYPDWLV